MKKKNNPEKYHGLIWLTSEEAAEKIGFGKIWLLTEGIHKYKIPFRPWGYTYRFIAEELDAWGGKEMANQKLSTGKTGKTWLTAKDAAMKLKVSEKWLKTKGTGIGIPHKKFGRNYRFVNEDLDDFPGFTKDNLKKSLQKNKNKDLENKKTNGTPSDLMNAFGKKTSK